MSNFNSGFSSNRNEVGGGALFNSIAEQKPQKYWTFDDKYPQYIQVQRIPAKISGTSIKFNVNRFDPNTFLKSKAYIKVRAQIQRRESEVDAKEDEQKNTAQNFNIDDRIYRKPGLVLHNACTSASLRLNSHTMIYEDLRYITKKMNMSFAGKNINDRYFSTSGSSYEEYNGVYNKVGEVYVPDFNSTDALNMPFASLGFDTAAGAANTIAWTELTNTITFAAGAGGAPDLFVLQIFNPDDIIVLASGEIFRVIGVLTSLTLLASRQDAGAPGDVAPQALVPADIVIRALNSGFNADRGRQEAYDSAFRDITVGATESIFKFTEPLSFGCFNHLEDYDETEIYSKAWNNSQTNLIPYINQLELQMAFKDIATNALIFPYGRVQAQPVAGNNSICRLIDNGIISAELVLFWVKPRDELLLNIPPTVRIQSWKYEHFQINLGSLAEAAQVNYSQNNTYTDQIPSYLMLYGMVDKDSSSYICSALVSDLDGADFLVIDQTDNNAVESGMSPSRAIDGINSDLQIRSNTLGGDDILDSRYNEQELYRLTLKYSVPDFPFRDTVGNLPAQNVYASYPGEFYLLLGERDLNSFFIRKGQTVKSYVLNISGSMTTNDGYSIRKIINGGAFNGGTKIYALHTFYIYDRFYIELSKDGQVDSKFDSRFF